MNAKSGTWQWALNLIVKFKLWLIVILLSNMVTGSIVFYHMLQQYNSVASKLEYVTNRQVQNFSEHDKMEKEIKTIDEVGSKPVRDLISAFSGLKSLVEQSNTDNKEAHRTMIKILTGKDVPIGLGIKKDQK